MNDINNVEILLVEDNPDDADLTIRALRKKNLANQLEWVKDGAQALDFLFGRGQYAQRDLSRRPSVMLLDLRLPKVDGLEVLRTIRADDRLRTLPIVVLTSSTQDQDMVASYQLGVNSFVSKPVQFEEFAEVVANLGLYWLLVNKQPLA